MSKNILILINIITCVKINKIVVRLSYHFPDIENQIFCTKKYWNFSNDFFPKIQWDIVRLCTDMNIGSVHYKKHYYLLYDCLQKTESLFCSVNVLKYHILRLTYLAINITITMSARRNTRPAPIPTPRTRLAGTETRVPFNSTQVKSWTIIILFKWY